ncbi:putative leucine-rich repeat domain superfamily, F-box-like domain superfamily [Helianthus annuus]|nr:putative leucine-rich repeat domain superfamily, F-box-like domain superfamily [Helianthus annuus]
MSSYSIENQNPNHPSPLHWLNNDLALNHVICTALRRRRSLPNNHQQTPPATAATKRSKTLACDSPKTIVPKDFTSLISDEILIRILSKLPEKSQGNSNSLVSKRWLNLQGRLVRSVRVLDWDFLISGRMFFRFPNVTHVDLVHGTLVCNSSNSNYGMLVNHEIGSFRIGPDEYLQDDCVLLPVDEVDFGLKVLASVYPNLIRLVVVNCSEIGLLSVAEECLAMQELVLHQCNDNVLVGIAAFSDLKILKLVGVVDGFYKTLVSDRGLTILAQGCKRLVKLELQGCEGGYEGIKAVGECCQMLEELTFCDHRMDDGWLSALSYCESLRTLKFVSCKGIDRCCELDEHLGFCPMLERLHLERCQLRDKQTVRALFLVCQTVEEVVFKNCWGFNDAIFFNASLCRRVKLVSIEGCSRLTTQGLEAVVLSWKELESLKVISCKNIKDDDVTPMLSVLFSDLKDFKWCPGNSSYLSTRLASSNMGKRGAKFFKKFQI